MSFSATGARRPLQSKPKQNPFLRRTSSTFSNHARTKPSTSAPVAKRQRADHDDEGEALHHGGIVTNLVRPGATQDVLSLMRYIRASMFEDIPERSAGMNSTRIAEVLNFRKNLAPIVSVAHLHAISASPTATDREIATLIQSGTLRRITIPGRGRGGAPVGDGVVLVSDWITLVRDLSLATDIQDKYIAVMSDNTTQPTISTTAFTQDEISQLVSTGLLTTTSALAHAVDTPISRPGAFSLGLTAPVADAGTTAPTGSLEAVGGIGAVHLRGGGTGGVKTASSASKPAKGGSLTFAIPGTGAYLRLVTEARAQLVQLITKSSPRHKEGLRDLLKERWDGNVLGDDAASRAKRARGEWTGLLPGKTKKWKTFYGMGFEWVLEECLGSGTVECFDTGSVGLGVRVSI
ncbi:hypothetical protein CAC42_3068 [Sphaceloma murrayae]|uniref:Serine-threonine protein kinase 19-domain-containing protein n=1 Tax=Sphaceloma murrayae TaxID=2082308 RepID=A0A2K1QS38_9PEZI|nr:hypothetical protein CAC42_3068 [Sphaceloma murrayae]